MSSVRSLILASSSVIRKTLLENITINFDVIPAHLNERDYPPLNALKLAKAKALKISQKYPIHWIIGADQICHLNGHVFHKPQTIENAIKTLTQLNGETHELITAVTLANKNEIKWHWVETIKMQMKQLSTETIKNYVATDHPYTVAAHITMNKMENSYFKPFPTIQQAFKGFRFNHSTTH